MGVVRRSLVRVLWLMAWAAAEGEPAAAQSPPRFDARLVPQASTATTAPGIALAVSAVVPGAGQFLLKADRWVPFFAIEIWGWVSYVNRHNDANHLAQEYRDLAWVAGRRNSVGERRDSTFEYYEAMSHFSASGLFDFDPRQSGVQPELDVTTYNGEQWRLAKSIYFTGGGEYPVGSQQYNRALEYYQSRAIPASFAWAWGASNLELQTFRELIRSSDESYRDATQILGVILVNHVVSAVDAFVLARLQSSRSSGLNLRLDSHMERGRLGPRWNAAVRLFW